MGVNTDQSGTIAVVDPYGSGRLLVAELCRRGCAVVAVRSSLEVQQTLLATWNPVPFQQIVVHHGIIADTSKALLAAGRIKAVIAGHGSGVELADALSEHLGLRGNCPSLSRCRWDKHAMHERLGQSGIRACAQRRCVSVQEAEAFLQETSWPVVVKPCASASTDNVYKCYCHSAVVKAITVILSSKDICGRPNQEVLVQEFLDGTEYVVDCVSVDGKHLVTGMWEHEQKHWPRGFVHRSTTTLPYGGMTSKQEVLREYVLKCLTALGVDNGASHSKVMLTASDCPCLIDMGACLHGSIGPALWSHCTSLEQSQPYLVADVFLQNGAAVSERLMKVGHGCDAYTLSKIGKHIDLHNHQTGVLLRSIEHTAGAFFRSLPTLWRSKFFVEEGDRLRPTRDVSSSPGYIILVGASLDDVERDAKLIRKAEREGRICVFKTGGGLMARSVTECAADPCGPGEQPIPLSAESKFRELDLQTTQLLSPVCVPAESPKMSPAAAPASTPGEEMDELMLEECEFTLAGCPLETVEKLPPMGELVLDELSSDDDSNW